MRAKKLLGIVTAAAVPLAFLACTASTNDVAAGGYCDRSEECTGAMVCANHECTDDTSLLDGGVNTVFDSGMDAAPTDAPAEASPPGDSTVSPDGTPPQDTGTPPQDTGTAPQDTGTAPQDTGTAPQDTGTAPQDTGTAPQDTGTAPQDTGTSADTASDDGG